MFTIRLSARSSLDSVLDELLFLTPATLQAEVWLAGSVIAERSTHSDSETFSVRLKFLPGTFCATEQQGAGKST